MSQQQRYCHGHPARAAYYRCRDCGRFACTACHLPRAGRVPRCLHCGGPLLPLDSGPQADAGRTRVHPGLWLLCALSLPLPALLWYWIPEAVTGWPSLLLNGLVLFCLLPALIGACWLLAGSLLAPLFQDAGDAPRVVPLSARRALFSRLAAGAVLSGLVVWLFATYVGAAGLWLSGWLWLPLVLILLLSAALYVDAPEVPSLSRQVQAWWLITRTRGLFVVVLLSTLLGLLLVYASLVLHLFNHGLAIYAIGVMLVLALAAAGALVQQLLRRSAALVLAELETAPVPAAAYDPLLLEYWLREGRFELAADRLASHLRQAPEDRHALHQLILLAAEMRDWKRLEPFRGKVLALLFASNEHVYLLPYLRFIVESDPDVSGIDAALRYQLARLLYFRSEYRLTLRLLQQVEQRPDMQALLPESLYLCAAALANGLSKPDKASKFLTFLGTHCKGSELAASLPLWLERLAAGKRLPEPPSQFI